MIVISFIRQFRRPNGMAALCLWVMMLAGCATPAGEIFPPLANAPRYPGAPDTPRIFYVGQIATSDDLKPAVSGLDAVGRAIFGKKDIHGMLSPFAVTTDGRD